MSEPWTKRVISPPVKCDECGRIYPEGSGWIDGKVEIFMRGDEALCVACAVKEGVAQRAPRR